MRKVIAGLFISVDGRRDVEDRGVRLKQRFEAS